MTGKDVNELGYYPDKSEPDAVVVQGDLEDAVAEGRSARIRVVETYTDPVGYTMDGGPNAPCACVPRPLRSDSWRS